MRHRSRSASLKPRAWYSPAAAFASERSGLLRKLERAQAQQARGGGGGGAKAEGER
jgi:hypothetical protein